MGANEEAAFLCNNSRQSPKDATACCRSRTPPFETPACHFFHLENRTADRVMPPQIAAARPQASGAGRGRTSSTGGVAGAGGFRGTGPFKPPRPTSNQGSSSGATPKTSGKTVGKRRAVNVDDSDNDDGNARGQQRRRRGDDDEEAGSATDVATDNDDNNNDGDNNEDEDDAPAAGAKSIPPALLARLLHHFFQNPNGTTTRLTQDAHAAVGKYMEIFVREAVARSVAERGDGAFLDVGCCVPLARKWPC